MSHSQKITIINRKGKEVALNFNKILNRLKFLIDMSPKLSINADYIAQQTINQMGTRMTTSEIDELAANICSSLIVEHIDYDMLASRILVNNLHKETHNCIKLYCDDVNEYYCNNIYNPLLADKVIKFINYNQDFLNLIIDYNQDYTYEYFGIMTLLKSYLLKHNINGKFVIKERPQQMIIRVVIGLNLNYINEDGSTDWETLKEIKTTYKILSDRYYTHATPTLFNSGTRWNNLSSCFLLEVGDSMEAIKKSWGDCASISRYSGGIGMNITKIRAKHSVIRSTNGTSDGLVPMLKTFDSIVSYVSQGGGKRKGSAAVYIEPWHADIIGVLNTAQQHGAEELLCRNLFIAMWINDIFMERVEESLTTKEPVMWSLFCPDKAPGLIDTYGDEFNNNYKRYEDEGIYNEQIPVLDIWKLILKLQVEKGMPYMSYKDAVNKKTNQNNLGTINSSNLCNEIVLYTDKDQIGVCNLSSICLPKFVRNNKFDYKKLYEVTKLVTINMNKVIDHNRYVLKECQYSDEMNRPIGIGVQGLGSTFMELKLPFTSNEAKIINKNIFETIYYAALETSMELAQRDGPYKSYETSMMANGQLQFDLWNVVPSSGLWDWSELRQKIKQYGIRNSLLLALMPTASTANINGNTEAFEPITSNMYTRSTLSGKFQIINKYLIRDLIERDLWNDEMMNRIIAYEGSIQHIDSIPQDLKEIYKTVYEYRLKDLIDMDADRNAYVCQTSSSNRFMLDPSFNKLTKMHLYCWKKGLKTGSYYIRTKASVEGNKMTANVKIMKEVKEKKRKIEEDNDVDKAIASKKNKIECTEDVCTMCSA